MSTWQSLQFLWTEVAFLCQYYRNLLHTKPFAWKPIMHPSLQWQFSIDSFASDSCLVRKAQESKTSNFYGLKWIISWFNGTNFSSKSVSSQDNANTRADTFFSYSFFQFVLQALNEWYFMFLRMKTTCCKKTHFRKNAV